MKIYASIPTDLLPTALTIGMFDGVHLGHQYLLRHLSRLGSFSVVLTFTNHPLDILQPEKTPLLLTPLSRKLELIESTGVNAVIAIPFTKEVADLDFETFLQPFPLTHLVLGMGSVFGKNRQGNAENLTGLAKKRNFTLQYLEKQLVDGLPISSQRIRLKLAEKDMNTAARLLGREEYV